MEQEDAQYVAAQATSDIRGMGGSKTSRHLAIGVALQASARPAKGRASPQDGAFPESAIFSVVQMSTSEHFSACRHGGACIPVNPSDR
jgi:hypothetical protein